LTAGAQARPAEVELPAWADVVATAPTCPHPGAVPLQVRVVDKGVVAHEPTLEEVRAYHAAVRRRTGSSGPLLLDRHL
jgi:hypothetical protein